MKDCVILINDRLVSLTHNSLLLIQPPTCPQSRSPTCVRVLVRVFGAVGTVEKVLGTDKILTFAFWKIWPPPNLITDWINLSRLRHFGLKSTRTTKSSWEFLLLSWRLSRWGDMSDEIGSGDNLASEVQDALISPTDLAIPVHNVALECGFVLSRISSSSDEVIGYKSPVFQDNNLTCGQVWEPSISRNAFPWHVWDHINRWGRNNWRVGGCCLLLWQGEASVPVLQERIWILHEKYFVIIRSSGFCNALSIHTHLLELHCLRGSTTKKKSVVLKFLELSLSTMSPRFSWVWVQRFLVLKLNSWQTYVVLNSTHCNQGRSSDRYCSCWHDQNKGRAKHTRSSANFWNKLVKVARDRIGWSNKVAHTKNRGGYDVDSA